MYLGRTGCCSQRRKWPASTCSQWDTRCQQDAKQTWKKPSCCSLLHMYSPSLSLIPGNGCQQRPRPGFNATAESIGLNLAIIAEWCVIFNGAGTKLNSKTPQLMALKGVIFCYCRFNRPLCRGMEKTMLVILARKKEQQLIWPNNS